ncbi:putative SOS response-associated peptidase YedK [Pedobacter sp. UYP30]|uniref:SOS response-associated peptidase family protein n=1 Tax=Pedobacter sp. UYP30 TaxID=1756400 RepID=UPI00339A6BB7
MCSTVKTIQLNSAFAISLKQEMTEKYKQGDLVFPKGQISLITDAEPNILQDGYWSLVPSWSPTFTAPKYSTFNAKKESLTTSKTWMPLLGKKHCALICEGFIEWHWDDPIKKIGSHKYYLHQANSEVTIIGGLWESWKNRITGEIYKSCTMITNPANEMMAKIHNAKQRMPAMLTQENYKFWIDSELSLTDRIKTIEPIPNDFLTAVEVPK